VISRTFCPANLDCASGSLISRSTIARLMASSALAAEIADQRRGRAADFDDTPLEQLDTRGTLGHGRNIGHADPKSESLRCAVGVSSFSPAASSQVPQAAANSALASSSVRTKPLNGPGPFWTPSSPQYH
jgi:hypothetical protein